MGPSNRCSPRLQLPERASVLIVMGPVAQGGAEWQILELLRRLDRARFRPVLASVEFRSYKELRIGAGDDTIQAQYAALDVPHYRITGHSRYGLANARDLLRVIRREKIDLVHANLFAGETWGRIVAVIARKPIVTHKRGMPFKSRRPQNVVVDWLLNLLSSRIIVVTRAIQRDLQRLQRLPDEKFTVVYPGIEPALWARESELEILRLKRELGLEGVKVVTAVGRIRALKGQRYLIDAVPYVLQSCPDTHFLLVGHGAEEAELRSRVREEGLERHVTFLGGRSDVRSILSLTDVFVLPSLSEASPVALMEAAFIGVPSVATRVGGVPEIVKDGETGLLVAPADANGLASAVVDLLGNPDLRMRMGAAAKEWAHEAFDIERTVRQIETEYARGAGAR